jgi:acetyl esterase/lipase
VTVLVPAYTLGALEAAADDVVAAVAFAEALAQGGRLTLGGHSAGAQLAALVALQGRVRVEGLLLVSGVYDLPAAVRGRGLAGWLVQHAFGTDSAVWEAQSPHTYVRADAPPTWVVQGAWDTEVRPDHTEQFAARLREASASVTWSVLPGTGHLDAPLGLLAQREAFLAFLRGPDG